MVRITIRFYAELNDFLPADRRARAFDHEINGRASVKDVIESLGVPHTEVDLILVNGESVGFGHVVAADARLAVYPVFEAIDVTSVTRVRPTPLRDTRFVLDVHLGRLAAYLRLAGFDALQPPASADDELVALAVAERRILLTRDQGMLKRRAVTHGYYVRSTAPAEQLREVVARFDLAGSCAPFSRCLRCNTRLAEVAAERVRDRVPPRVRETQRQFRECPGCGRVYWAGTHHARMRRLLEVAAGPGAGGAGPQG